MFLFASFGELEPEIGGATGGLGFAPGFFLVVFGEEDLYQGGVILFALGGGDAAADEAEGAVAMFGPIVGEESVALEDLIEGEAGGFGVGFPDEVEGVLVTAGEMIFGGEGFAEVGAVWIEFGAALGPGEGVLAGVGAEAGGDDAGEAARGGEIAGEDGDHVLDAAGGAGDGFEDAVALFGTGEMSFFGEFTVGGEAGGAEEVLVGFGGVFEGVDGGVGFEREETVGELDGVGLGETGGVEVEGFEAVLEEHDVSVAVVFVEFVVVVEFIEAFEGGDGFLADFHDGGGGGGDEFFDGIEGAVDGFEVVGEGIWEEAGRWAQRLQEGAAECGEGGVGPGEEGLVFVETVLERFVIGRPFEDEFGEAGGGFGG